MISYAIYKLLHYFGLFLLYAALGGLFLHAINGGTKESNGARKLVAISHGVALFIILLGGFGMLARLGEVSGMLPTWVILKLVIWLVMGAMLVIPYRAPALARPMWLLLPALGLLSAWIAVAKPGYEAPVPAAQDAAEQSGLAPACLSFTRPV